MKIVEVTNRTPDLINQLLEVWESSVLATYLFLSDGEIKSIKEYVSQALNEKYSRFFVKCWGTGSCYSIF